MAPLQPLEVARLLEILSRAWGALSRDFSNAGIWGRHAWSTAEVKGETQTVDGRGSRVLPILAGGAKVLFLFSLLQLIQYSQHYLTPQVATIIAWVIFNDVI
jgi:hypothetical protein